MTTRWFSARAQILSELFPGILADLVAAGVPVPGRLPESGFSAGGHLLCRDGQPDDLAYLVSRPYLEGQVRRKVQALSKLSIQHRCEVTGLAAAPARDRVTGARVLSPGGGCGEEIVTADLVVDAAGRGGRAPAWLTRTGYDPPAEEQIRVDVKYASQLPAAAPRAARRHEADRDRG